MTNSAKMKPGCAVELTTGTVLENVRKLSKTGSRWAGEFVAPCTVPGMTDGRRPGQPSAFHSSSLKRVLTADELAGIKAGKGGAQ